MKAFGNIDLTIEKQEGISINTVNHQTERDKAMERVLTASE